MKLRFLGATRTVTGSFFVLETAQTRMAVDCGLFQGSKELKERNYKDFPVDPQSIDLVILTHAHIDHTGLIPKLCKHGFKGPIYCSEPTLELASVMLPDSGHIQETEVERKNRKALRAGRTLIEPIYTMQDALDCIKQLHAVPLDEVVSLAPDIKVQMRDAGHILGSCILELWAEEDGKEIKLVFSGDLGNLDKPIIKDPSIIEKADYVIMESTYGSRLHNGNGDRMEQLQEVIDFTMQKGGNLVIPAFAVERTQDMIFDLNQLYREGRIDPGIDVFIDSPLAIAATKIFEKYIEYYDSESSQMVAEGKHPLQFPGLKLSSSQEESMQLNTVHGNSIIISASGMCDAGRIKHHLKHNLWRPESTVLFVGYQAEGTLGRRLLDGEKLVHIHGEAVSVRADIKNMESYSSHADQAGLIRWLKHFTEPPKGVFLVHGEENGQKVLAELIQNELHMTAFIPDWQEEFELIPSAAVRPTEVAIGDSVNKALEAEQMYLDLRLKLHNLFQENWSANDYDKLIEKLKKISASIN